MEVVTALKAENASLKAEIEILKTSKVGCFIPVAVVSIPPHAEFGQNGHSETDVADVSSSSFEDFHVQNEVISDDEKSIVTIIESGSVDGPNELP